MSIATKNNFIPTLTCFSLLVFLFSCTQVSEEEQMEKWKKEIRNTEKAFTEMAAKEGIDKAFLSFAAEEAVLMRNNKIIGGKIAIARHFEANREAYKNGVLSWEPEFVDVARSGDLGYTYGPFTFTVSDSLGNQKSSEGIFHTVWKKQVDGSWKFVWD